MSDKKGFDKYKDRGIGASKEKLEQWGVKPEELGWDGEEEENVEELEDGGTDEELEEMSWEELKNNPEVANQWYNERVDSPTEEEMLENAGGKWQEEKSQAEKIGEAVAKHIDQPHQEEQTEELQESSPETQEPSRNKSNKDLPPKWEKKLKERGNSWIQEEELSSSTDSVLKEVKSNTEVTELSQDRKRIDTSSIRAIAELNSLNQKYPDKVNILKTDRKNNKMSAIVDTDIKQLL